MATDGVAIDAGTHGHRRYGLMVAAVFILYSYAFVDRAILALLVEPIKADLRISDVQMGLLLGVAFALFYSVLNVPAGYLVDRVSRRGVIAAASIGWSLMTVYCGLSSNFAELFLGRAGVGLAEAVIVPAAFSLIQDAVPLNRRGRAYSIFAMSPFVGTSLSLMGGGALTQAARSGAFSSFPLLGALHPWQVVLVLVGLIGLPLVFLLLLFREPKRARADGVNTDGTRFVGALRVLRDSAAVYLPLIAYTTFSAMMMFCNSAWAPSMLARTWGLAPQQIGPSYGPAYLVAGVSGLIVGGYVIDRITARGGDLRRFGAVTAVGTCLGLSLAPHMGSYQTSLIVMGIGVFFGGTFYPIGASTLAQITPRHIMGKITALYLLFQTLISQALGPVLVAWVAEHYFDGARALGSALSVVEMLVGLCAAASVVWLIRVYPRFQARAQAVGA